MEYTPAKKAGSPFEITGIQLHDMMIHAANRLITAEAYLSRLDSIVGDGDHGVCMAMGMRKAADRLMNITGEYLPGEICQIIGKTMLLVGGASGVFFGSMFLAAAESLKEKRCVKVCDFADMWYMAQAAVEKKGGACRGEKTLIDALAPAVDAMKEHVDCDYLTALRAAEAAAEKGMLETKKWSQNLDVENSCLTGHWAARMLAQLLCGSCFKGCGNMWMMRAETNPSVRVVVCAI